MDGEVILGEVRGILGGIHLEEYCPGNVEAQVFLILTDALGTPGTAVVAQVHPELYQMLRFDVADSILNQRIVCAFFTLQHRAGCLKKTALKSAFGKMQRHIH